MVKNYYDPVKAHEYYLKNRKLKGRHSVKGMSQQQKEQWAYARDTLKADAKTDKAGIDKNTKREIGKRAENLKAVREKIKKDREHFKKEAQSKIKQIQAKLKNMTPEQRKAVKAKLYAQIANIRSDNKAAGAKLTAESKNATAKKVADSKNLRNKGKEIKTDITNKTDKAIDDAYKRIRG